MGVLTREQFLSYLNTTPTAEATYELIGDGFSELTEALNPKQKDSHYIHNKSQSSSIIGYAPTFDFTAENYEGDPAAEYVAKIGRERMVGNDCETDIVNVNMFEKGTTEGTYVAYKQNVAIKVDQVNGGAGGDAMSLTGSFLYKGDAIKGEWNPTTKAFAIK